MIMKIFKSSAYPTKNIFLSIVCEYREYCRKRSLGEIVAPVEYPEPVLVYAEMLNKHERYDFELEELEFLDLTEDEYLVQQAAQKKQKDKVKKEVLLAEGKEADMLKAIQDVDYRERFLRNEVYANHFYQDDLIWNMVEHLSGVKSRQTYFNSVMKAKAQAEKALRALANTKGVIYVEK